MTYEETLKIARNLIKKDPSLTDWVINKFPELKEIDERVRKELISFFTERAKYTEDSTFNGLSSKEIISWLEKQGEQKLADKVEPKFKTGTYVVYLNDTYMLEDDGKHYILTAVKKNTSTPVVHIPYGDENFTIRKWTIQDAKDGDVLVSTWKGCSYIYIFKEVENNIIMSHIFYYPKLDTIDMGVINIDTTPTILATKEQRDILFAKIKEARYEWDAKNKQLKKIIAPIFNTGDTIIKKHNSDINNFGQFTITDITGGKYWYNDIIICDITEQDEWEIYEPIRQKPAAWSEEDKNFMHVTLSNLTELKDRYGEGYGNVGKCIDWLKSLKDRVRPQNLTVTDEELAQAKKNAYNDALDKIEYNSGEPSFDDGWSAAIWYLKKKNIQLQPKQKYNEEDGKSREEQKLNAADNYIKERGYRTGQLDVAYIEGIEWADTHPLWKPSDDQIDALKWAVHQMKESCCYNSPLMHLYQDLKKLKE